MTRAAGEAFERLEPDKRILMYSRSACIGMHRYGGIWTGDNHSWWSHILLALHMMPSLNMCGFLYEGPDIGGFGSNTTEDLVLRWYGLGIFSPLLRNHSANGTRRQEPYRFKNKAAFAGILQLRYLLLPYIYSEYMKAALHDGMYCMPLAFAFPEDDFARQVEDEVMIGESLLIAPVYEQNARGRYVYLPEEMLQVRVSAAKATASKPVCCQQAIITFRWSWMKWCSLCARDTFCPLPRTAKRSRALPMWILQICACLPMLPMVHPMNTIPMTARQRIMISRNILCISRWMRMETQRAIVLRSK